MHTTNLTRLIELRISTVRLMMEYLSAVNGLGDMNGMPLNSNSSGVCSNIPDDEY